MADIIDFPIPKRPQILTWQCTCGSFSFKLLSNRAALCTECGYEAVRQFGFWEIKDLFELPEPEAPVIPLRLFRESPEDKIREQALLEAGMQSPIGRRILEKGHVTIVGLAPPKEGEW